MSGVERNFYLDRCLKPQTSPSSPDHSADTLAGWAHEPTQVLFGTVRRWQLGQKTDPPLSVPPRPRTGPAASQWQHQRPKTNQICCNVRDLSSLCWARRVVLGFNQSGHGQRRWASLGKGSRGLGQCRSTRG